ncbi:MAG: helix-turn-helix domain-containing protein [Oscillospiraceae bacterium]|nr:helix-turn-helix domain-containing protein [Oscillospiraceae bacterium]
MSKSYIVRRIINALLLRKDPWDAKIDFYATGEQLRSKRLEHNLTQEMLSDIICELCVKSATKNAISAWERGRNCPSLDHLAFLAWLYDCSIDELLVRCEGSDPQGAGAARPLFLLFSPPQPGWADAKPA